MARTPMLDQRAQRAVRLIANADAGFTQAELGAIFHVSRDCIARVLRKGQLASVRYDDKESKTNE